MSRHDCNGARGWIAVAALALAAVATAAGAQTRAQMQLTEKKLVESRTATYRVTQGGREIGSEAVTVSTYSTNTVVYEGRMVLQQADDFGYEETTRLEVEEDSYFPRTFTTSRELHHGEKRFPHRVSIEMFGNLAVCDTQLRESSERRRVTVPAGAVIVETGVFHLFEQLLAIYNEALGERQSFQALDALTGRTEQLVVERAGAEEAMVGGKAVPATLYTVARDKFTVKLFVDAERRVVRGEMTEMVYELVSWERHGGEGQ